MKLTKSRARKLAKNKRRTKRQMMKSGGKLSLSFRLNDCFLDSASNNRAYLNTLKKMIQEGKINIERINVILASSGGYSLVNNDGKLVFMYHDKSGDTIDCDAIKKIAGEWDKFSLEDQQKYSLLEYRKGRLTRKSRSLGWLANMLDPPPSYTVSASVTPPSGAGLPSHVQADLNSRLLRAADNGNKDIVQQMLTKGANIDHADNDGKTAFIRAAWKGHKDVVQLLIEQGANIEHANEYGWTALLYAVNIEADLGYQKYLVQLLIDQGANIEHANIDGMTALSWAASYGHKDVVQLLLTNGADPEHATNGGITALLWAALNGHKDVVQLLLTEGANIEHADNGGRTALLWAAYRGRKDVVQLLIDQGANIEHANKEGKTALFIALYNGHKDVVQLLIEQGANTEHVNKNSTMARLLAEHVKKNSTMARLLATTTSSNDHE